MKSRIFLFVIAVFNILLVAQPSNNKAEYTNQEKYFNIANQRFLLNGNNTLNQISSFFGNYNLNLPSASALDYKLLDSYTFQNWNTSDWQNDSSEVYAYNQNNLLSEKIIRNWSGSQWINKYRYLYIYDASTKLSVQTEQYNTDGYWVDSLKKEYTYNSQGLLSTVTTFWWTNSTWEYWELMTSIYNNNQLTQDVYQNWNGSSWENSQRTVYEYYNNNTTANITFNIWLFGSWINLLRIELSLNSNGLLSEFKLLIWDFFSGWANISRLVLTYDNNFNLVEGLWQDWDSNTSSWINYSRVTTTYNPNYTSLSDLTELWFGNNSWVNDFLRTYDYDSDLNRTQIIGQIWNGSNWTNSERELYTYNVISSVNNFAENPDRFILEQNYPNPFNPSTTIKFSLPSSGYTTLKIYNSLGQEVAVLINKELTTGTSEVEWNASSLPSGIYFYQLKTDGFVETKKMILMK